MFAVVPNITGHVQPHAYGINCRPDGRWEAVLNGEVVAVRNTPVDAGYALIGFKEDDDELGGLMVEDMIGLPAIEQDQISLPSPAVFGIMALFSAAVIGGTGWIVWAIVHHLFQ